MFSSWFPRIHCAVPDEEEEEEEEEEVGVSLGKMRTETEEEREGRATHHTTRPSTPTAGHINTNDLCLRTAYLLDEVPRQPPRHAGGVGTPVNEVAHEDQPRPSGCSPLPS